LKEYYSTGSEKVLAYVLEKPLGGSLVHFEVRVLGFCPGAILAIRTHDGIIKTYSLLSTRHPNESSIPLLKGDY